MEMGRQSAGWRSRLANDPRRAAGARGAAPPRWPVESLEDDVRRLLAHGHVDAAATEVIQQLGRPVRAHLRRWLRDEADAGDAFSVFEEHVWVGLRRFRGDASLRTWVYRIARNAALDVRKQAWQRHRERLDALPQPAPGATRMPLEERDVLERLRRNLSDDERALLSLRVDHELPWAEIARALSPAGRQLGATTAIKRFHRIAARLRRMARRDSLPR